MKRGRQTTQYQDLRKKHYCAGRRDAHSQTHVLDRLCNVISTLQAYRRLFLPPPTLVNVSYRRDVRPKQTSLLCFIANKRELSALEIKWHNYLFAVVFIRRRYYRIYCITHWRTYTFVHILWHWFISDGFVITFYITNIFYETNNINRLSLIHI